MGSTATRIYSCKKVLSFGKLHLFILLIFSQSITFILRTPCIRTCRNKALRSCKRLKRKRLKLLWFSLCIKYWVVFPRYQVSLLHFCLRFQHHLSLNCSVHFMSLMQEKILSETLEMWDSWTFRNKGQHERACLLTVKASAAWFLLCRKRRHLLSL